MTRCDRFEVSQIFIVLDVRVWRILLQKSVEMAIKP